MFRFDEQTHTYTLNGQGLPSVTGILKDEGFVDTRFYDDYGRTRGEYVHKAAHLYDTGQLDEAALDPVLKPYLDAWKKFLNDSLFHVLDSEVPRHHPRLMYAGTPDKVGFFDVVPSKDIMSVIDIKTGAAEPWTALQLAGYAEMVKHDFKIFSCNRYALELKPDGNYKLITYADRQDTAVWLAALTIYHWKHNNGRRNP